MVERAAGPPSTPPSWSSGCLETAHQPEQRLPLKIELVALGRAYAAPRRCERSRGFGSAKKAVAAIARSDARAEFHRGIMLQNRMTWHVLVPEALRVAAGLLLASSRWRSSLSCSSGARSRRRRSPGSSCWSSCRRSGRSCFSSSAATASACRRGASASSTRSFAPRWPRRANETPDADRTLEPAHRRREPARTGAVPHRAAALAPARDRREQGRRPRRRARRCTTRSARPSTARATTSTRSTTSSATTRRAPGFATGSWPRRSAA